MAPGGVYIPTLSAAHGCCARLVAQPVWLGQLRCAVLPPVWRGGSILTPHNREITMKVRIGVGFSGWPFARTEDFWDFVDLVEESGLDSIWLNDRIRNPTPALEPITGLAMIAGRTERIKFGMSVAVLPVRDPLVLAKEIARSEERRVG